MGPDCLEFLNGMFADCHSGTGRPGSCFWQVESLAEKTLYYYEMCVMPVRNLQSELKGAVASTFVAH